MTLEYALQFRGESLRREGDILDMEIMKYNIGKMDHSYIRSIPELISVLLWDRTRRRNIRWATDSYLEKGSGYYPEKAIRVSHVRDVKRTVITPRVSKELSVQKDRTKASAEVFTPTWVVKKQNDLIEEEFKDLELEEYVAKTWLEITCGEGPYMCSRYDMVSGEPIEIKDRVGFVDRKLQRISREVDDHDEWARLVTIAYKSSFGYEFQGDSLLLARENMLYTFIDYYIEKFDRMPLLIYMESIAKIISYNVFQMDGLKYIVPMTDGEYSSGTPAIIKDWDSLRRIKFKSLLEDDVNE